jgi:hypothetical protein
LSKASSISPPSGIHSLSFHALKYFSQHSHKSVIKLLDWLVFDAFLMHLSSMLYGCSSALFYAKLGPQSVPNFRWTNSYSLPQEVKALSKFTIE